MTRISAIMLTLLCAAMAHASEHYVSPGGHTTVPLTLEYLKETMIALPEQPLSVTGAGEPMFQIEPGVDFIMIRPLRPNARGNLFVHLGNRTIITFSLSTRRRTGEKLVSVRYGKGHRESLPRDGAGLDSLRIMASPWEVVKLRQKSKGGGVVCKAHYALILDDRIIVSYSVKNNGAEPFTIMEVNLVRLTLGGFKGNRIIDAEDIPAKEYLGSYTLGHGDVVNGVLIFPRISLDHDQSYAIRFVSDRSQELELRVTL